MAAEGRQRKPTPRRSGARPSRPTGGAGRASGASRASRPQASRPARAAGPARSSRPARPARAPKPERASKPERAARLSLPVPSLPKIGLPHRKARTEGAAAPKTGVTPPFMAPTAAENRARRQQAAEGGRKLPAKAIGIALAVLAGLAVVFVMVVFILSNTSAFTIAKVEGVSSKHVSAESIERLAKYEDGATLLNVDTGAITQAVMQNPWVESVQIKRVFPDTLQVSVTERRIKALVMMNSGEVVWCLGTGDVWIEPISVKAEEGQDFQDAALAKAEDLGALLVTDSPASVSPEAGSEATDATLRAVSAFQSEFSDSFTKQVVSYSAASANSISCTLKSGVTISLGSDSNVESKEEVIKGLLDKYPDRITYINVRVPSNPSYRMIDSDDVTGGTGATTSSDATAGQSAVVRESEGSNESDSSSSDSDEALAEEEDTSDSSADASNESSDE